MRLWSLHPKYLDSKGLVALWREALLAQKVLQGKTSGYRHHPQLHRFKHSNNPNRLIGAYLLSIYTESLNRGYRFDKSKIITFSKNQKINVTRSQLYYEFDFLCTKLKKRSPTQYKKIHSLKKIDTNPLFTVIPGPIEEWEKIKQQGA